MHNETREVIPKGRVVRSVRSEDCVVVLAGETAKLLGAAASAQPRPQGFGDPERDQLEAELRAAAVVCAKGQSTLAGGEGEGPRTTCVSWSEEQLAELVGTCAGEKAGGVKRSVLEFWRQAVESNASLPGVSLDAFTAAFQAVSTRKAHGLVPGAVDLVVLPPAFPVQRHSARPSCYWRADGEQPATVELVAARDIYPGDAFTVCVGAVPRWYAGARYGVALEGAGGAGEDEENDFYIEFSFEIPPQATATVAPHVVSAAARAAAEGRPAPTVLTEHPTQGQEQPVSTHRITLADPYPNTFRMCARAFAGKSPTEEQVDQVIESLFTALHDRLQAQKTRQDVRSPELDLLIAALSRLSHATTLRKGGPCHRITRSPPTAHGETLAGVPLQKCLTISTSLASPDVTRYGSALRLLTERQIRIIQVVAMRQGLAPLIPDASSGEFKPFSVAHTWTSEQKDELKGTEAERVLQSMADEVDGDLAALKSAGIDDIDEATWRWASDVERSCSTEVKVPEEAVVVAMDGAKAQPVAWEDEDGDRIEVKKGEDGTSLAYSVNGEARPAVKRVELSADGTGLDFPEIDRAVDLPPPDAENISVYRSVLSTVRALADEAKVAHDIPASMTFGKPAKTLLVIAPGAAKLPHHSASSTPRYSDGVVWFTASPGEGLDVCHFREGNAETLVKRHAVTLPNRFTSKSVHAHIACRPLGSAETEADKLHGAVLQVANLIAADSDEVTVTLPDLEKLQAGESCSFLIAHRLTRPRPLPKSLWWCSLVSQLPAGLIAANQGKINSLEDIDALLQEHCTADIRRRAAESIVSEVSKLQGAYPTTLEDDLAVVESKTKDNTMDSILGLALRLRVEEKQLLRATEEAAKALMEE
ncbi:hypothetical protein DIPPA_16921 [Diplonema papillatum]|nr:hypothetical protein DIPPA_16921 [Diplonema papillatum]